LVMVQWAIRDLKYQVLDRKWARQFEFEVENKIIIFIVTIQKSTENKSTGVVTRE
jgi:hypothetical protein